MADSSSETCSSSSSEDKVSRSTTSYLLVSAPVAVIVDRAADERELRELLVERAMQMGVPRHLIVQSGLFRVFREEVVLSENLPNIEFLT